MSTYYTFKRENGEWEKPRVRVERYTGCDGTLHAVASNRVHFDEDGGGEYAEDLGAEDAGQCDGSCEGASKKYFFTHSNT